MPAEAPIIIAATALSSASFFLAAGLGSPDPLTLAQDAAQAAQQVIQLSEERTLAICLGGGLLGSLVALGFNLFKGSWPQKAMLTVASTIFSVIAAPYFMLQQGIPLKLIPCVTVSGAIGLLAHLIVPMITDFFPRVFRFFFGKWFPLKSDEADPDAKTTKLQP